MPKRLTLLKRVLRFQALSYAHKADGLLYSLSRREWTQPD